MRVQDHDGNLAGVGAEGVVVVGGVDLGEGFPEAFVLFALGGAGGGGGALVADLEPDFGVGREVVVPGGVGGGAAFGGDDDVAVAGLAVDEGEGALLAAAAADGKEEEGGVGAVAVGWGPVVAVGAVGVEVALGVVAHPVGGVGVDGEGGHEAPVVWAVGCAGTVAGGCVGLATGSGAACPCASAGVVCRRGRTD